jgi:3-dehydroquinate synthase
LNSITVNLGKDSYDILTGNKCLDMLGPLCKERGLSGKAAIVTNPNIAALYGDIVTESLLKSGFQVVLIEVKDGEEFKTSTTLNCIYDKLIDAGLDRNSFIVALGGGVVGDMAGFAAATYLRGIHFVQVPTSLLSQVDSSVGGKTAIDHPRGKNLIGAFYQPSLVLIDVDTLKTLPVREFRAGLAEVVKYGIILDSDFFKFLENNLNNILSMDKDSLVYVIQRCCQLKAQIVEQDEKESGLRAVLNYGHTLGHALETSAGYGVMVHGEAVAIGMVLAARISFSYGHCSSEDVSRITGLLNGFQLQLPPPEVEIDLLKNALETDKKSRSGVISFICNCGIGGFTVEKMSIDQLFTLSGLEV